MHTILSDRYHDQVYQTLPVDIKNNPTPNIYHQARPSCTP